MNGHPVSRYGLSPHKDANHEKQSEPAPAPVPPKPQPRTTVPRPAVTVSRPVTVGALREAKEAASTSRVPITQRAKAPEIPARFKKKKKTIAFGVTTNVSQTVEREKDPIPPSDPPATRPVRSQGMASLGRTGVGADRYTGSTGATGTTGATTRPILTTRHTRQSPALPPLLAPPPIGDENKNPSEVEETISHLETRVVQLEKRERESREREQDLQKQFERLVKHVGTLVSRVAELEGEKSEEEEAVRARRRLQYSSDEGGEGRRERGRKPIRGRGGGEGLLNNEDTVRALERQLTLNPLLRRQLDDALEQDKYEREYGEKRTNERTRRANYMDEYDEPRAPAGRCAPSVPTHHRWKEETGVRRERSRGPPSGGTRGGVGATRKRMETTPSRRRVTERVTMERVHHFDDDSEDESGGGGVYDDDRYDSDVQPCRTQYDEEVIDDFQSVAQPDGRRGYSQPARRNQQQYGGHRAVVPVITEMSDSDENSLDRKRRLLQERKEARGRGGRNK